MGNHHSSENGHHHHVHGKEKRSDSYANAAPAKQKILVNTPYLVNMFSKLEKASESNEAESFSGYISEKVFEEAFNGPLKVLGNLLFKHIKAAEKGPNAPESPQPQTGGRQSEDGSPKTSDGSPKSPRSPRWVSRDQFLNVCSEILSLISDTQQNSYYFDVFSEGKEEMSLDEVKQMVQVSFAVSIHSAYITHEPTSHDKKVLDGLAVGMMGSGRTLLRDNFETWCQKYCRYLFNGIHCFLMLKLSGVDVDDEGWRKRVMQETPNTESSLSDSLRTGSGSMSYSLLWVLSCALPSHYNKSMPSYKMGSPGSYVPTFLINKLHQLTQHNPWTLLYNSDTHGLSTNRFEHHVLSYRGSSVSFYEFGSFIFALATDQEWKQSSQRWGGEDTMLIQLLPHFSVLESGSSSIYMNLTNRAMPKGIQCGRDVKELSMKVEDMSRVKVKDNDAPQDLQLIEVWGCAEPTVKEMQLRQKQWENREAEKLGNRKLKLENWEDNPDRMLLSWAGIQTNHAEKA